MLQKILVSTLVCPLLKEQHPRMRMYFELSNIFTVSLLSSTVYAKKGLSFFDNYGSGMSVEYVIMFMII